MINKIIPYGKQEISEGDIEYVVKALKSDYLTQGPKISEFEIKFAEYIGCKYAVAVTNGTAALHLCALALDVKKGQKVITTPITFAASANCIQYCGGDIVFCDIDPDTYLIDIKKLRKLLCDNPKGTFSGIVSVDFAGRAVNLELLKELADEFGLWILEDACHAPGGFFIDSQHQEQRCGNGNFADLAVFSFHPVKHIACGEGGMITTNNESFYNKLLMLRTHGITKNPNDFLNPINLAVGESETSCSEYPSWYMEMQCLGYNYRITDFQAALGISQLKRANQGLALRKIIAQNYESFFADKSYIIRQSGYIEGHAYHLYIIEVHNRLGLYNYLKEHKIYAQIHYIPCHLMPYYRNLGWEMGDLPDAENYYKCCISLPMYPTLSIDEQNYVIKTIDDFYTR